MMQIIRQKRSCFGFDGIRMNFWSIRCWTTYIVGPICIQHTFSLHHNFARTSRTKKNI